MRVFFLHHATFSVNSVCHFLGRRRFDTDDESRNVSWLALPSLGEAWHHNHHAFPRSAIHGLRWWEVDLSAPRHPWPAPSSVWRGTSSRSAQTGRRRNFEGATAQVAELQ